MPSNKSYEQPSESNWMLTGKLLLYSVLAQLLCLFVYVSVVFLVTSFTTSPLGYQVYEMRDGQQVLVDTVYFAEQSDSGEAATQTTAPAETTATQYPQTTVAIRTEMPAWANVTMNIVMQILLLLLWVCFAYSVLWKTGDRDKNSEDFHHSTVRPLRGLQIGCMTAAPYALVYLALVVSKLFSLGGAAMPGYYRLCHVPFYPILNQIMPVNATTDDTSWGAMLLMLALWAVLPLVCHLAYTLGHKRLSVLYKTVYKNKQPKRR